MKKYEKATIKNLPKSQIEIEGSVSAETFASYREKALKNINEAVTIDGFRKGNIPEKVLVEKVGEKAILEEMAEIALSHAYPEIVVDNKLDPLGQPQIHISKMAAGNALEFKITTSVSPDITLPDYKKLASEVVKKDAEPATEKELEEAIARIRSSRVNHNHHDHSKMTPEEHDEAVKKDMPELTDEFVQGLGDFKDVADFKEKIKLALTEDKAREAHEKHRMEIAEKIVGASTIELPPVMVDSELRRSEAQFRSDIERMGMTMEDYLERIKKNLEDIKKEWIPHAEKKIQLQLVLNKIAELEKIVVDPKEIETEVKHILEHYKDADAERAHVYAQGVLTNEKVFEMLEKQSSKATK